MCKLILAISVVSMCVATGASAQQHGGSEQEQKACARDVSRFCRKIMEQGDLVILSCLKQNRPKLTPACNNVLLSHGQ